MDPPAIQIAVSTCHGESFTVFILCEVYKFVQMYLCVNMNISFVLRQSIF
jgi:hypothetical protein